MCGDRKPEADRSSDFEQPYGNRDGAQPKDDGQFGQLTDHTPNTSNIESQYTDEIVRQQQLVAQFERAQQQQLRERQQREEEEHNAIVQARMQEIIQMQQQLWEEQDAERREAERQKEAENIALERQREQLRRQEDELRRQQERLQEERRRLEQQEREAAIRRQHQQQQQQQQQQQAENVRRVVPNTSRMSQPGAVSAPGPNSVSAMSKMDLLQQEREALERRQREIEAQNARRPAPVSSGMRQLSDELSELEERQRELMLNQQRQERSLLSSTIPHEISTDARSSSVSSLESWRIQNGNGQRVDDSRRDAQQSALGMIDNGPQPGAVLSIRAEQSRQLEKLNQSHGDSEQRQREIQDQTNSRPGVVHSKQARALEKINLDRRGVAYAQQQQSTEMEQQNRERIEAERRKLELARQTRGSAIETTQPPPTISPVASQRRRGRENVDRSQFEQEGTQQTPSSRPGAVSVGAQQARELQKIRSSNERPSLPGTVSAAGAQQARALQKIQSSNERPRVQPGAVSAASAQQARELQKMQSSNQKHQNRDEEKTQSEDSSRSSLSSAKKLQVERDAIQQVQNLNLSSNFNYDSDELAEFQEAAMAMNKVRQRKRSSPKQRSKKPEPRPSRQDEIFQSMHSVDSYGDVAEFEEAAKAMNTITERVITNATGQSNRRIQGTPDADLPRTTRPGITSVRADDSEGSIRQLRERQKQLSVSLHSSVHSTEVMPLRSDHSQASASLTSSEIFVTAKDNPPRPKLGVRATSDKTSLAIEPSQLPAKSYRQYTLRQEQPQPPSMPTTTEPGHRNGQISRTDRFARIPSESSRLNAAPPRRQPSDDGEELDT